MYSRAIVRLPSFFTSLSLFFLMNEVPEIADSYPIIFILFIQNHFLLAILLASSSSSCKHKKYLSLFVFFQEELYVDEGGKKLSTKSQEKKSLYGSSQSINKIFY